jgi:glycerophosphoryl diester phosphodiesterase
VIKTKDRVARVVRVDAAHLLRPIAHRGLHVKTAGRVENTASAFEAAIARGYGIECDLQPSGDGSAVVFHDHSLGRLTEGKGPVKVLSRAALGRVALRGTKDRILSLPQFLELVAGRVPLLIEIKSDWKDDSGAFARSIAQELMSYQGAYGLMSFDPRRVQPFGELLPGVPRGIVAGGIRRDLDVLPWLRRWTVKKLWHNDIVQPDFLAYFVRGLPSAAPGLRTRPKGMPLFTWTVRTPADQAKAARHADAMIFEGFEPDPVR